jgi:hypothetical protein
MENEHCVALGYEVELASDSAARPRHLDDNASDIGWRQENLGGGRTDLVIGLASIHPSAGNE